MGAVMYDTPFYAPMTAEGQAITARGQLAHGTPANNTMLPFIRLAKAWDIGAGESLLAFIAGAASHMIADTVFHPFVEYFCKLRYIKALPPGEPAGLPFFSKRDNATPCF